MLSRRLALSVPALICLDRDALAQSQTVSATSPWSRDTRSAIRLIAGDRDASSARAGLQITLAGETKTYWRTPGDSGVPPSFDWSGSTNVASVAVGWPAPKRFPDGGGFSIGYDREVVFPLTITPAAPTRPGRLALKLDYAVCDTICIPAKGESSLALDAIPTAETRELIRGHQARVPTATAKGFSLALLGVEQGARHPVATLLAETPDARSVDLFAEGPNANWALPLPEARETGGRRHYFRLVLDGVPRGVAALGHDLTFTLVADDRAIETKLRVG